MGAIIKNNKLLDPLGTSVPLPAKLESAYAGYNLPMIENGLIYLEYLMEAERGFYFLLAQTGNSQVSDQLRQQISVSKQAVMAINDVELLEVLNDVNTYSSEFSRYTNLTNDLTDVVKSVKFDMTSALNVNVGVNSSDGD